jgi:3-dehydroquinate synthase
VRLGMCPPADAARVRAHFAAVGLPTSWRAVLGPGISSATLLVAMTRDKKVQGGRPRFVLVRGIGQAFAGAEVAPEQIRALLDADGT